MFTGLVEGVGLVGAVRRVKGSIVFTIHARSVSRGLRIGESIAVNGVCLTVVKKSTTSFAVQAVEETLRKTNLGKLSNGSGVNLERPLLPTVRLGGHFVLGHVDCMGNILSLERRGSSWLFWISVPKRFTHYLVPTGSIAVDGVSLTIAQLKSNRFAVSIIPHTMKQTIFSTYRVGDKVNLEFDVLGKYVGQMVRRRRRRR
jgi:riboflavin synthase